MGVTLCSVLGRLCFGILGDFVTKRYLLCMTFALQVSSLLYLNSAKRLKAAVYTVPAEIDRQVASLKLASLGLEIDELTADQRKYLDSWEQGT